MWDVTHFLTSRGNVAPIHGTKYSTAKSVVNNNSVYETKTISGGLISEKKTSNNEKCLTWRCLRVEYTTHQHQADRASDTRCVCYVQQITSTPRFRGYSTSVLRTLSACYYNIVSRVVQMGRKQKIGGKQRVDSQMHIYSLTSEVEKACREKSALRSSAVT